MQLPRICLDSRIVLGQSVHVLGLVSARRGLSGDCAEDQADDATRLCVEDVLKLLEKPPKLDKRGSQAPQVLMNAVKEPVPESMLQSTGAVLVHVYHLSEGLSKANTALSFSSDIVTLGGAFHAAVEVYGGEWTYGSSGVSCIPPRSEEAHVYECSIYMGRTELDRSQLAPLLLDLVKQWSGSQYDLLSRNCCSFAAELCRRLGVGELPCWIDRFPRLLHSGREAGCAALRSARGAKTATAALVWEVAQDLPGVTLQPWVEEVARMVQSEEPCCSPHVAVRGGA